LNNPHELNADERLDDLQNHGLMLIQKKNGYRFGMDAVLLAHFACIKPNDQVADMGTGSGVLPLLMSQREPTARFFAIEKDSVMADLARRNVEMNGLTDRVQVSEEDWGNAAAVLGPQSMDAVVCNPPFGKQGNGPISQSDARRLACHEAEDGLVRLVQACAVILKNRGRLWLCFPAARILELSDALRACQLEPKLARLVCSKPEQPPYLLLLEAVKNAAPGLRWMPILNVLNTDNTETEELRAIYGGDTDENPTR